MGGSVFACDSRGVGEQEKIEDRFCVLRPHTLLQGCACGLMVRGMRLRVIKKKTSRV